MVGLIEPLSHRFCHRCDRIRVTADGKLKPCLHSEIYKIRDFILVKAFEQHHVQLCPGKARRLCRPQAIQHMIQPSYPGHMGKTIRPEGVQADIQPRHPRFPQGGGKTGQGHAVGGQAAPVGNRSVQSPLPLLYACGGRCEAGA